MQDRFREAAPEPQASCVYAANGAWQHFGWLLPRDNPPDSRMQRPFLGSMIREQRSVGVEDNGGLFFSGEELSKLSLPQGLLACRSDKNYIGHSTLEERSEIRYGAAFRHDAKVGVRIERRAQSQANDLVGITENHFDSCSVMNVVHSNPHRWRTVRRVIPNYSFARAGVRETLALARLQAEPDCRS